MLNAAIAPRFLPHAVMLILFVADLFHPVDNLTVELFLNGDVRHGRSWCGSVPVFLAEREPDHITRPDLLDRSAFALDPTAAIASRTFPSVRATLPNCFLLLTEGSLCILLSVTEETP
jgi:hypothetical protein